MMVVLDDPLGFLLDGGSIGFYSLEMLVDRGTSSPARLFLASLSTQLLTISPWGWGHLTPVFIFKTCRVSDT